MDSAPTEESLERAQNLCSNIHQSLANHSDKVITVVGEYDGKYESTVSLSTHLINATVIGVNSFIYDEVVIRGSEPDEEELSVLMASLLLHDSDKIASNYFGVEVEGNTREALELYFEEDPFDLAELLDDVGDKYFEDILYLIQRTETGEDASETRGFETDFEHLVQYCRLGDSVASAITTNGFSSGVDRLEEHYFALDTSPVRTVSLNTAEQTVLYSLVLEGVKKCIAGRVESHPACGVIIGGSSNQVVFLGSDVDRDQLKSSVKEYIGQTLPDRFGFSCKVSWNSFGYNSLCDTDLIPVEKKKQIIADSYAEEVLESGSGMDQPIESVSEEVREYLPELVWVAYESDSTEEYLHGELRDIYQEKSNQFPQKAKVLFVSEVVREFEMHKSAVESVSERVLPELEDDLSLDEHESDPSEEVVDRVFGAGGTPPVKSNDQMCFLCGAPTSDAYEPGTNALYQSMGFTKRAKFKQTQKRICPVCNLESSLLIDICETRGTGVGSQVEFITFYSDDFVAGFQYGNPVQSNNVTRIDSFEEAELTKQLFGRQFTIQPVFTAGGVSGDRDRRLNVLSNLFKTLKETGVKAELGDMFKPFRPSEPVFTDRTPVTRELNWEIDTIDSYSELQRADSLLSTVWTIGRERSSNQYLVVDDDSFLSLAHTAEVNIDGGLNKTVINHLHEYHREELEHMKQVAQSGVELYGYHRDSKHSQTDVFREALTATLAGLNKGFSDDQLRQYVAGQVHDKADRKTDYTVTHEQSYEFVDNLFSYLNSNGLFNVEDLSGWENRLVNAYRLAYEQIVYE